MKRILIAWMAVAFAAASADAVPSVRVESTTGTVALTGETITLLVRVSVSPGDGVDAALFGALVFPDGVTPIGTATQNAFQPTSPGVPFLTGALSCTSIRCVMFNQAAGVQGAQSGNVTNFVIASQTYRISAFPPSNILHWTWQSTPSTLRLDFFNAPAQVPALSITLLEYVPEPTTGALVGMGLLGLAAARRRS